MKYTDLIVWQKSMELVEVVYRLVRTFPPDERFRLCDQLSRAVVSIPSNIAEGNGRESNVDYSHFLKIARGSLYETMTQLEIAKRLGYLRAESGGQRAESGGMRAESRGQRAESGGMRAESRGQRAESGGMGAESRGMRAESRGMRAESGGQRAESRGLRAESEVEKAESLANEIRAMLTAMISKLRSAK